MGRRKGNWANKESLKPKLVAYTSTVVVAFVYLMHSARRMARQSQRLQTEIARRDRISQELQQTKAYLSMMIDSAQDYAIFALDPLGMMTVWNEGAERLFGYPENEVIGRSFGVLFTPEDQTNDVPRMELARAAENGVAQNERWHRRKDGSQFFASGMTRRMTGANGKVVGFIKVARDITDRVHAEEARLELLTREQEARRTAEEANRIKLQFVAMISHELRSPLTSIKGFASTLLADDVRYDTATQQEFLQIIDQEADKLNDLVEQLLDMSRMQAGTLRIQPVPDSVQSIVDTAMTQMTTVTGNHRLTFDIEPNLPTVWADRQRVAQVLVNLVHNAAKYSAAGTEITLAIRRVTAYVHFSVCDEGVGIPAEKRASIFEAFQQLAQDDAPQRGAGLGLAICKGLVEAHHGQIWIEDQSTPGTTIAFSLPVDDPEQPA